MSIDINSNTISPIKEKMEKSISVMDKEFQTIRAGRANARLLDGITVAYYGVDTPLSQVANIQVPEARMLMITPWDASLLKEIERSLQASNLGINPNNDGKCIRLAFPPLTEERRLELGKQVAKMGENCKISIRNIRRDGIEEFKLLLKNKEISEDAMYQVENDIQKLTDDFIAKTDKLIEQKKSELMEI